MRVSRTILISLSLIWTLSGCFEFKTLPRRQLPLEGPYFRLGEEEESADKAAEQPSPVVSLMAYPNPFPGLVTITFELERPEKVQLSVHDPSGRQLALVTEGSFAPGEHSLSWEGRDSLGRDLASGTYLVRLASEEKVEAMKVALVR